MDICEADCRIVLRRLTEDKGHTPVAESAQQPGDDRNDTEDGDGLCQPLDDLPHKERADHDEPERVEQVRRPQELAREACSQRVGQYEKG